MNADPVRALEAAWRTSSRWVGTERPYGPEEVISRRPPVPIEHSLALHGSERLWAALDDGRRVSALGAVTGGQAVQMALAGLDAIYVSGWQIAADNNLAGETFPDQSLYPWTSTPALVSRINRALLTAGQLHPDRGADLVLPLVVDAEAGFGGPLHTYEVVKHLIEAGSAAVHIEDQDPIEKKCGHVEGRVLVSTEQFVRKLVAARLAADVAGVPTVVVARTDALGSYLVSSDADPADGPFLTGERTSDGHHVLRGGIDAAIARGRAAAPHADLLWCEVEDPDLDQARRFAEGIREGGAHVKLAYNCTLEYDWFRHRTDDEIASFLDDLEALGYQFLFVTIAGFQNLSAGMFDFASSFAERGLAAYVDHQKRELELQKRGYANVNWQHEVGTDWYGRLDRLLRESASRAG